MKEFCNTIQLFLAQDIQSVQDHTITLKPGKSSTMISTDEFSITPKEETSESGTLYSIEEDITIDKAPSCAADVFKIRRKAILQLETYPDHEPIYIGTLTWPALVSITTHLNKDTLHIHSKMPRSPL